MKYISEGIGTFLLVAVVVGSGIMAENLSAGNMAVALLGNTIATGGILFVLIKKIITSYLHVSTYNRIYSNFIFYFYPRE